MVGRGVKWRVRQLPERPSICLQMEVLNSKFFFFLFTSRPRQQRNVSPLAGECVILLCHSKPRLSFPLKCLRWKNIMALVSTPQPPIRLIMPSLSPDKCQSAFFFFFSSTINKRPLFKQEGISAWVWIPSSLRHKANVTPQLNLNPLLLGKGGQAYPDGRDVSLGQILLAPPLIILTASAKFKWPIKCTH